jgi:hypothetical protein
MPRTTLVAIGGLILLNGGLAALVHHMDRYWLLGLSLAANAVAALAMTRIAPPLPPVAALYRTGKNRRIPIINTWIILALSSFYYLFMEIFDSINIFTIGICLSIIFQYLITKQKISKGPAIT